MRNTKLFWGSSYDRGLEHLLRMWVDIKKEVPEATLDVCYGWGNYDVSYRTNPERMAWKEKINKLMEQDGITHHGRLGFDELARVRKQCGIWAYSTHFTEISCITAMECMRDGVVPVIVDLAALMETVPSHVGIHIQGDIWDRNVRETYKNELIGLMKDRDRCLVESYIARESAKQYDWNLVASKWEEEFNV